MVQRRMEASNQELSRKLVDGIENSLSKGEKTAVRWIWELLQNAKDATSGDRKVSVEITIT